MKEESLERLKGLFKKAIIKAKKYGIDFMTISDGDEKLDVTDICLNLGNQTIVRCKDIGRKALEFWQVTELIEKCKYWIEER